MKNIKKVLVFTLALAIAPFVAMAQYGGPGSLDINAGIGFGTTLTGSGLPISATVDYGYNENISLGGYFGFAQTKQDFFGGTWTYTNIIIGARGAYHHEFIDNIDTYAGVMLGYNVASASWDGPGNLTASVGGFTYSTFAGARYHFSDKLGAYGEVGYGVAFLNLGVTYRLK